MMTFRLIVLWALPWSSMAFGGISSGVSFDVVGEFCLKATRSEHEELVENCVSARRSLLVQVAALTAWGSWSTVTHATADCGTTPERPVAALGGGGRTGMEVAQALAREGLYAVTMTRSGKDPFQVVKLPDATKSHVSHCQSSVNVCDASNVLEALKSVQASAVIFCASASKQGGSAFQADDVGVGNAAEAARALNARFILTLALAVDRPDSKSYQITNTLGGNLDKIMDAKRQGEEKVRATMKNYIIVRPGPLMSGKGMNGAVDIELNQGDTIGGGASREELAGVVVGALVSGKQKATVEAHRKGTATKLQPEFDIPSGQESTSVTHAGLFAKVKEDTQSIQLTAFFAAISGVNFPWMFVNPFSDCQIKFCYKFHLCIMERVEKLHNNILSHFLPFYVFPSV